MEQSIVVGLITFFLGLILGHRLSLGRDKRKEFNEISAPIRLALLQQIKILESNRFISKVSSSDFDRLEMYLSFWQVTCFRKTLAAYKDTQNKCGHTGTDGGFVIDDLSGYIKQSHKLLSYASIK